MSGARYSFRQQPNLLIVDRKVQVKNVVVGMAPIIIEYSIAIYLPYLPACSA
jgi:hypothetical protein